MLSCCILLAAGIAFWSKCLSSGHAHLHLHIESDRRLHPLPYHNPRHVTGAVLQIASCSMHHSGALLLEARDGEFLDEQLCCSSIAASTYLQQPDQQAEQMRDAGHEAMDAGHSCGYDEAEGLGHGYDDGDGGADDGDDYMQQDPADLDAAGMPGLLCYTPAAAPCLATSCPNHVQTAPVL